MIDNFLYPYAPFIRQVKPSHIRVLHASPDAPPVDIYANNNLIAQNIPYKGFTPYISVAPGNYVISVFVSGTTQNPVLVKNIQVPNDTIATIAATGYASDLDLLPIVEPVEPIPTNKTMIRFVHLSPNTPNIDITLPNGTVLFEDVEYEEATEYIPAPPGNYTVEAKVAGTDQTALIVPNINLKPNRFYSIYAVGFLDDKPPLQVLIPLDGNSYIK
ncbi:DUF4397 domain-containing protein [Tepidibacter aestuarii]|uniref:DUF4397 domain-containing protein n=1 Tax=Tepidibacter aestuarii TaxID=2925782 RepID=UPI0020BD712A|nr:DUF4397 domain-containing protein [Tepidibacter aestuarii]CAH2213634.1 conserved protein of unknown function [Tepidibacter aestuarii]